MTCSYCTDGFVDPGRTVPCCWCIDPTPGEEVTTVDDVKTEDNNDTAPDLGRLEELWTEYMTLSAIPEERRTDDDWRRLFDVDCVLQTDGVNALPALLAAAQREAALRAEIEAALKLLGNEDVKWPQPHPELLTATAGARRTLQRWAEEIKVLEAERDALRGLWTAEPPKQDGFYWWRRDAFRPGAVVQVMGDTAYYLGEKRHVPAQGGEWSGPLLPPTDDYRARAALGGEVAK